MRTRIAAAVLAAAALLALTACNPSDDDKSSAPSSTPSVDMSSAEAAAGIPPKPDADTQAALFAALHAIDPKLITDSDKTVRTSRNQCSALDSGAANPNHLAAERFGTDDYPFTDDQGKAINAALRSTLCPKK